MTKHGQLSDQQIIATDNYIADGCKNWYKAMIDAGYSEKYAQRNGWKLLDKDAIQARIAKKTARLAAKAEITASEVISGLRKLAGLDPGAVNVTNQEKIRAFELLGKRLALFTDNIANTGDGLTINVDSKPEPTAGTEPGAGSVVKIG
jgi:hypothetical protein